jgi:hypothetical protein
VNLWCYNFILSPNIECFARVKIASHTRNVRLSLQQDMIEACFHCGGSHFASLNARRYRNISSHCDIFGEAKPSRLSLSLSSLFSLTDIYSQHAFKTVHRCQFIQMATHCKSSMEVLHRIYTHAWPTTCAALCGNAPRKTVPRLVSCVAVTRTAPSYIRL